MLEELWVRNLGCLDEKVKKVSLSEETILIGPNNSGKSTFITGLNVLRSYVLAGGNLQVDTSLYRLENWNDAVYNHEPNRNITVQMVLHRHRYSMVINRGVVRSFSYPRPQVSPQAAIEQMKTIWYLRPNRSLIPYSVNVGGGGDYLQPQLSPSGHDVIQFLLEKYTERNPNLDIAEEWFKKIDPEISSIRVPIRKNQTYFEFLMTKVPVNASLQGSGLQSIASIIAAVIFSPKGSTLIIEEPEICLHMKSQETIVDLFNDAVNNQGKQIIFSTHSWDMLLPFISDVGRGAKRGKQHVHADPAKFKLLAFNKVNGHVSIEPIDLRKMKVSDVKSYLKKLWG